MNPSMAIQQTVDTEILKQLANIFQTILILAELTPKNSLKLKIVWLFPWPTYVFVFAFPVHQVIYCSPT